MSNKKVNKLNSDILSSLHSKYFVQKRLVIEIDGKDYEILLDEKFSTIKLQEMMFEFFNNLKNLMEHNEAIRLDYYMFLIIKNFSDIDLAKTNDFEEQIKIMEIMDKLDIFNIILKSFNQEEIDKAAEFIKKIADKTMELSNKGINENDIKKLIEKDIKNIE